MKEHELKCWPEYFLPIYRGLKTFEIRLNDRDFNTGDTLILQEYDPDTGEYTGREITVFVKYAMLGQIGAAPHLPTSGLVPGYVIMSFDVLHIQGA